VGFFELLGEKTFAFLSELYNALILVSNIFYWSFAAFFKTKLRRRGETIRQSLQIGVSALPIIALIAFLIGFILALQSAAQLRQFGANIYVADLVAVAMVSEMGPLITAIMVAGRSGSAIAAEIGTMKVSEEMDALHVMGIDPVPYLIVPKLYAIVLTLPLLTILANIIGIIGGMVIGITYLNLDVIPFYNEVIGVLRYKEIFTFLVKSVTFAVIIVVTGTYFGLKVKGGAEGVGKMTTAAVVTSIFLVIIADSILGLIFYFGEPPF
jgi:phospholipid/cholesterol/gamma-HCH transport system permease protein